MENIEITAKDGITINARIYGFDKPDRKAAVIICHGFGEHSGSYTELAMSLEEAGYACIVHDQRGHGKPPEDITPKKWFGRLPDYQCFIDDILSLTDYINEKMQEKPIMLYGHSMGGNIVINTLLRLPQKFVEEYTCAALESPWLDLYNPPKLLLKGLVTFMSRITPNLRITHKMKSGDLSSLNERADGYTKDPLYHGVLSARMITGIFNACKYALINAGRLPIPTYLAYADDDTVVSNTAILEFAEKAGETITLKEYASKHAIHNDVSREALFADVIAYMDSKL